MQQLGRAVVNWNALEHLVNLLLANLLGQIPQEQKGFIIFAHMNFSAKLEIFNTLMAERKTVPDSDPLSKWKPLSSQLKTASTLRNRLLHSLYSDGSGTVIAYSLSARGKLEIKSVPQTLKGITHDVDQIVAAAASLSVVLGAIGALDSRHPQAGQ